MKKVTLIALCLFVFSCTTKFKTSDEDADGRDMDQEDLADGTQDPVDEREDTPLDQPAEEPLPCSEDQDCHEMFNEDYSCCGNECIDTSQDPENCGGCGVTCFEHEACCDGACVDTTVDGNNCGGCGRTCTGGEVCCNSECCIEEECCNNVCVDLESDVFNCGVCNNECPPGHGCQNGACEPCGFTFSFGYEYCYLHGWESILGKYSYIGHLAPAVDLRVQSPPDPLEENYYIPNYGFYTIDTITSNTASDNERDYYIRVIYWDNMGSESGMGEDDLFPTGLIAMDAYPVVEDGLPYVAYGGVQYHSSATGDAYMLRKIDLNTGDSSDVITPMSVVVDPLSGGAGWELPLPNEFVSSITPVDDPAGGNFWGLISGGAVLDDSGNERRAVMVGTGHLEDAYRENPPESVTTHVAYGKDASGNDRLYALAAEMHPTAFDVIIVCYYPGDVTFGTFCAGADWDGEKLLGSGAGSDFGTGLAASPGGKVVYSYRNADGDTVVGRLNEDGSQDTTFGGGEVTLTVNTGSASDMVAKVMEILVDFSSNVFIVGYQSSEGCGRNYCKTPTVWKLNNDGEFENRFGGGGRTERDEGIYSDGMLLCDGTILLRKYVDCWTCEDADGFSEDRVCLQRMSNVTGDLIY